MAAGDYGYTGSITKVTVGANGKLQAGRYDVVAFGGGGADGSDGAGGKGAGYGGYFTLTQGEKLEIVVGGAGTAGNHGGSGGGGFSEVLANVGGSYVPLLVAGGGGGGGFLYAGGNATIGAPGTGSGGAGGGADGGAGGAGSTGNGGNVGNDGANGGMSVANGARGGTSGVGAPGGFGGGGGGGDGGGGGGGYTGGGGGGYTGGNGGAGADVGFYGGAGGTSFLNKTYGVADIAHDMAGANAGKGSILFTLCFAAGTLIRTVRGEVAVEALQIGDLAVTASGAQRPIKWLGHRTLDCRRHPSPREAMPVRVAAHAFGENRPARDLVLSPGHSVCVDVVGGVLIPIGQLVNGATIAQLDVDTVTYWHVELESHDILLAENLVCESYIDCGTRAFFVESEVVALAATPDAPVLTTDDYCRSFKPEGALVDMLRDRLCLRASDLGWRLAVDDALAGLWLEVDGARIEPVRHGLLARVSLPADTREVRLRSAAAVPADLFGDRDERRLGLQLASVVIDDGLGCRREIACTDARLANGFHPHEGTLRWTDGDARLPAELWAGCRGDFYLCLAFAGPALPRWVAPEAAEAAYETTAAEVA